MNTPQTQISAFISDTTKALLESYVEVHGVKKGRLVEEALLHHLRALQELPADLIIPPRIVVSRAVGEEILRRVEHPRQPTPAMQALFAK